MALGYTDFEIFVEKGCPSASVWPDARTTNCQTAGGNNPNVAKATGIQCYLVKYKLPLEFQLSTEHEISLKLARFPLFPHRPENYLNLGNLARVGSPVTSRTCCHEVGDCITCTQ